MPGIEFVDEPDVPPGDADPAASAAARPYARPRRLRAALTAALTLAAAVLAAVAAANQLYRIGFGSGGGQFAYSVDASGAYHGIGSAALQGTHGPRYAPALIVCAAALLLVSAHFAARAVGRPVAPRLGRLVPPVALAATAALAGLTLAVYLDAAAVLDSTVARTRVGVAEGDGIRGDIVATLGAAVWCAVAATGCAVVAVILVAGELTAPADTATRRWSTSPDS